MRGDRSPRGLSTRTGKIEGQNYTGNPSGAIVPWGGGTVGATTPGPGVLPTLPLPIDDDDDGCDTVTTHLSKRPGRTTALSSTKTLMRLAFKMVANFIARLVQRSSAHAFGDGSDGPLVFDGSTTILGMAPTGQQYTLTRDIFATSVTFTNDASIRSQGFEIYATVVIDTTGSGIAGLAPVIFNNGTNGSSALGSTGGSAGLGAPGTALGFAAGTNGGAGGTAGSGANGTAGTGSSLSGGGSGGAGGHNALAMSPHTGGAGGAATAVAAGSNDHLLRPGAGGYVNVSGTATPFDCGCGGGGGGGGDNNSGGTNGGAGGGGGAGGLGVHAPLIKLATAGDLAVIGGVGGNGTPLVVTATTYGTGGGGGGGGGRLEVSCAVLEIVDGSSLSAAVNCAGGAGGLAGVGDSGGTTNGSPGVAGSAGVLRLFMLNE